MLVHELLLDGLLSAVTLCGYCALILVLTRLG